MPRQRRNFDRISGVKSPSLIVIATEGAETEQRYFSGIKDKLENASSTLQLKILPAREHNLSAPKHVLNQLLRYQQQFTMDRNDELCLVIDRDKQSWSAKEIAWIAQEAAKKQYLLAISNPSFELWLLLHHVDITAESYSYQQHAEANKNHFLKKEISRTLNGYKTSRLNIDDFWKNTHIAIHRAKQLDVNPKQRWPSALGTRVYLIVEKILNHLHQYR